MENPIYLGDGVYAQLDVETPGTVILTTGSHILEAADNTIFLEPTVLENLYLWLTALKDASK